MPADPGACEHLGAWGPGAWPFREELVLDAWNGTTDGVVRCARCDRYYLIEMMDADGPELRRRIYRVAAIDAEAVGVYRRNAARGSCDLGRAGRELEALLACAGPPLRLLACDLETRSVLAAADPPGPGALPPRGWRHHLPAADDGRWFERLGLAKGG